MKTTQIILAAVIAATSAIQAATAEHKLPAPLPEFKTPEQLAKWRQEMTEKAAAADALTKSSSSTFAFFTGKPFVEETGSYAFKFRQYDPELNRWTSADPSGFPDSANNCRYSNSPTFEFDVLGLTNKHYAYIYAYSGDPTYDAPSAAYVSDMVGVHMGKFQTADAKNSALKYVSDGDYIQYGSISNPNQLASFSFYDQIYVVAHGIWADGKWTGVVGIGGTEYAPSAVTASNLVDFKYCGPDGVVNADVVSGTWFYQVEPFIKE